MSKTRLDSVINLPHPENAAGQRWRPRQPANVGDPKAAALAHYNSSAYQKGLEAVAAQAEGWLRSRAAAVKRPALVLDIDETAWDQLARDPAIMPTLQAFFGPPHLWKGFTEGDPERGRDRRPRARSA